MNFFKTYITALARKPSFGTDEYKEWLEHKDFVQFLRAVPNQNEMVLYASGGDVYLYAVLVPKRFVTPPDPEDLGNWNCTPYSGWGITISSGGRSKVFLSPPLDHTGSTTLDRGEQIVFARKFDGRQEQQSYIEISPRLTHPFDLHYVTERSAYCRFDENGEVEDVIRIELALHENQDENSRIVTIQRDVLDEYLTMTNQNLVLLFDSMRLDRGNFNGWSDQTIEHGKENPEILYRMGRSGNIATYLRGFQIIRPKLTRKDFVKRYGFSQKSNKQYVSFVAHDWKHDAVRECSCDPKQLGNYFVESDLPFEISPVFFRPEVLSKYKADSDKYQVQDRSVACQNASWHLQTYDVNESGQVFTYLKYLGHLPYTEQLYWKSFNEPPKGGVSERALKSDFQGNWDLPYDPLQSLIYSLRELHKSCVTWWKLRDDALMEKVHYPITKSTDEWAKEVHSLDKLLVEGFVTSDLHSNVALLGRTVDPKWQSLKLLREILSGLGKTEVEVHEIVSPLQEMHLIRSKVSGHASGKEAKEIKAKILKQHKSYSAHFRQLCKRCDAAVQVLRAIMN